MKKFNRSHRAWQAAQEILVGGVNSPVRSFRSVGGEPIFIKEAKGSKLYDADGNTYIDYVGSWGTAILGHAHPEVIEAVCQKARLGLSFGTPTEIETELAQTIQKSFPALEKMRMVNSGTEACMSAIRLARGFTGRDLIVSFAGCYHGHADSFLGNAGSGLLSLDIHSSAGVPEDFSRQTLNLPYNDSDALTQVFERHGDHIAAVILEPMAANMNLILPEKGFLATIVDLAQRYGSLTIFDEVMSGFRVARGGAQALFDLKPDLMTLGKIVGGGMPVGVYGGRADVMDMLAPLGQVYQAGTLSGNPVAMAAGLATLQVLQRDDGFEQASLNLKKMIEQFNTLAQQYGVVLQARSVGTLFGIHFLEQPARNLDDIKNEAHQEKYKQLFHSLKDSGIYFPPSAFEAGFFSLAHQADDSEKTLAAFTDFLKTNN